jgi:hypothetical protein
MRLVRLLAISLAATVLAGCVTVQDNTGGGMSGGAAQRPPPRDLPRPPSDTLPSEVDLVASRYAQDSDKNGYADLINVTVYLFNPREYPGSLPSRGAFEFLLEEPGGRPLATWNFTAEETSQRLMKLLPGPGYQFKLTLLDKGGDELDVPEGQLWVTFTSASSGARPIRSRSPIRVAIGRGR